VGFFLLLGINNIEFHGSIGEGRMRGWERGSEPYLRVGREDRGRGGGGSGLPVTSTASLLIGLGFGGD